MDRSADPQQPLEITTGMKVAIGVLLAIGWASSTARRNGRNPEEIFGAGGRPTIVRSSGEPIRFMPLGVVVTPSNGWSFLSIDNRTDANRKTFVNESLQAIATIDRFPFESWPPKKEGVIKSANGTTVKYEMRFKDARISKIAYEHVDVEWLDGERNTETGFRYGRLSQDAIDLLIVILKHSSEPTTHDPVESFCDCIQLIQQP